MRLNAVNSLGFNANDAQNQIEFYTKLLTKAKTNDEAKSGDIIRFTDTKTGEVTVKKLDARGKFVYNPDGSVTKIFANGKSEQILLPGSIDSELLKEVSATVGRNDDKIVSFKGKVEETAPQSYSQLVQEANAGDAFVRTQPKLTVPEKIATGIGQIAGSVF